MPPEWLERLRFSVESEEPLKRVLLIRAINGVLDLADLPEPDAVAAVAMPTNLGCLVRALSTADLVGHK